MEMADGNKDAAPKKAPAEKPRERADKKRVDEKPDDGKQVVRFG